MPVTTPHIASCSPGRAERPRTIALTDLPPGVGKRGPFDDDARRSCQNCPVPGLSFCSGLAPDELAALNAIVVDGRYRHRETLFDQERPDNCVHVVTFGAVRLYRLLPGGRRLVLGFAFPGDFLGHSIDEQHTCTADAIGSVVACKISRTAFSDLLDRHPGLLRRLQMETARELAFVGEHMLRLNYSPARERVAAFLLTTRARWNRVNGDSDEIPLPMTRQDIGDYLGQCIETVSRAVSELVRDGLIAVTPEGVRVLDLAKMTRTAAMGRDHSGSSKTSASTSSQATQASAISRGNALVGTQAAKPIFGTALQRPPGQ